ncbi:MAG: hypothetical protein EXR60_01195 [Dehalococcoidia bacterium]|nr:hypothetical protein [Dehalococcoidia bacterium]
MVSWRLEATSGATVVRLRHRGLPNQAEFEGHAQGWREYFLAPMKAWLESRPRRAKRDGGPRTGRRATK